MDNTRICKICNRTFSNGKAMGGHMRSHLAKLPPLQNPSNNNNIVPPSPPSSSSSLDFPKTPSPVQSYRSLNLELLPNNHGARTASSLKPKRPRSKRKRTEDLSEQVSSITDDIFNEEDVAMCLVMLSRDKWTRIVKEKQVVFDDEEEEDDDCNSYMVEEYEDDGKSLKGTRVGSKAKTKYKCLLCNKVFKSYQALGGHKASHKRVKKEEEFRKENDFEDDDDEDIIEHKKMFKCPFCDKSFESGQALGGHKKIHFSYLDPVNITTTSYNYTRSKCVRSKDLLDLNLPAPEDDGEVSQVFV